MVSCVGLLKARGLAANSFVRTQQMCAEKHADDEELGGQGFPIEIERVEGIAMHPKIEIRLESMSIALGHAGQPKSYPTRLAGLSKLLN